jgi:hypothetical protein
VIEHFSASLSAEDQEMMIKEVEAMQSARSTHREIKTYVDEMLSELGVESPHLTQKSAKYSHDQAKAGAHHIEHKINIEIPSKILVLV